MVYKIMGRTAQGVEEIDEFETKAEAEKMIAEYRLAYQGSGISLFIKRCRN